MIPTIICYNYIPLLCQYGLDDTAEEYAKWGVTRLHSLELPDHIPDKSNIFIKIDMLNNSTHRARLFHSIRNSKKVNIFSGVGALTPNSETISDILKYQNTGHIDEWYSTNLPISIQSNNRIILPIGFEEVDRMENQSQEILWYLRDKAYVNKIPAIYIPYHSDTNSSRSILRETIERSGLPYVIQNEKLPFKEYMLNLSRYSHVACFPGYGEDIHRLYETIWMGGIPIHWNANIVSWMSKYQYENVYGNQDFAIKFDKVQSKDLTGFFIKSYKTELTPRIWLI